ncbi:hypothetical protein AX16_008516 [Volvariella volvacea WC 439]|nr:hypothetical protein AX16_008516 [Volvariella volvacea WC 439]
MLDVSLELRRVGGDNTLTSCLRKYTQYEKLGSKDYVCKTCGDVSNEASKRLSFRKLPPVLSFQFKRFEHKSMEKSSTRKIDIPVKFPATLNMAPYTTVYLEKGHPDTLPSISILLSFAAMSSAATQLPPELYFPNDTLPPSLLSKISSALFACVPAPKESMNMICLQLSITKDS